LANHSSYSKYVECDAFTCVWLFNFFVNCVLLSMVFQCFQFGIRKSLWCMKLSVAVSPLVRLTVNLFGGMILAWIFCSKTVEWPDGFYR